MWGVGVGGMGGRGSGRNNTNTLSVFMTISPAPWDTPTQGISPAPWDTPTQGISPAPRDTPTQSSIPQCIEVITRKLNRTKWSSPCRNSPPSIEHIKFCVLSAAPASRYRGQGTEVKVQRSNSYPAEHNLRIQVGVSVYFVYQQKWLTVVMV